MQPLRESWVAKSAVTYEKYVVSDRLKTKSAQSVVLLTERCIFCLHMALGEHSQIRHLSFPVVAKRGQSMRAIAGARVLNVVLF